MDKSSHRLAPALPIAAGAAAGFLLRRWQLRSAFDPGGQAAAGHPSSVLLALACAAAVAAAALLLRRLDTRSGYEESFSSGAPELTASAAAALLFLGHGALSLWGSHRGLMLLIGVLEMAAGLSVAITAAQRRGGVVPSLSLHVLPCVYLAVRLIFAFKQWSTDPVVQDYCYKLFASIAAMCATFHLGGFCLGQGQRRLSLFWCLAGVLFCAVSFADPGWTGRIFYAANGLWCAANAWQLLEEPGEGDAAGSPGPRPQTEGPL